MATKRCPTCNSRKIRCLADAKIKDMAQSGATGYITGAAVGAKIGSIIPIVGTVAGGVIGGILGGILNAADDMPDNRICLSCNRTWYESN